MKKKVLVFASGSKDGGGSGFWNLARKWNAPEDPEIVAVVSNHAEGGVKKYSTELGIPFVHMEKPYTDEKYREIIAEWKPDLVALSGWLKLASGLDPKMSVNIHPGPLPKFGGAGMYGHFVHEAVMEAYKRGEVTHSAVTMHFVTPEYDEGPTCFVCAVKILPDDTALTLGKRVNQAEHKWQPLVTAAIARGDIYWDGANPESLHGKLEVEE